ncbi:MAG: phosphoribosyltransferase [Bacteroidia bacterium]|nr:phosphoribosyltransferase [Bacteroidia bacterium]
MTQKTTLLLNSRQIQQRIERLAFQIFEDNFEQKELLIAGIAKSGYIVAERLCQALAKICPIPTKLIEIEVDKENPTEIRMRPQLSKEVLKNQSVVVVDDVLNSGKTLMYSLRPFLDADMRKIRTVLLVDRDHKRYPVEADFVGITLSTTLQDHIRVDFSPGQEAVYLE